MVVADRQPLSVAVSAAVAPAAPAAEALPPCLIVNPRSFRASRGLAARAAALATARGAAVAVVEGPEGLDATLASVLERGHPRLLVLAGDGTVRGVVERLSRLPAGAARPDLLLLPGGRTNLTASDLLRGGEGVSVLALLERALGAAGARGDAAASEQRSPLRIEQEGAPARHGFFLAGALLDAVIRHCHRRRVEAGGAEHRSLLGTPGELLGLGLRALAGRSGLACPELAIDAGARGRQRGHVRLLLVTTLLHRSGLMDPYAARGTGELRVTSVTRSAPRFWRSLPRLVTGRYSASMNADEGYLSGRCERLEITGLAGYTLDGEEFDADPARPLVITAGPRLRFLTP